nr:MAG TPA: Type 4 fimbrial biogenesis protein PilY2 [Caudoviricetes sp.]
MVKKYVFTMIFCAFISAVTIILMATYAPVFSRNGFVYEINGTVVTFNVGGELYEYEYNDEVSFKEGDFVRITFNPHESGIYDDEIISVDGGGK